MLRSQPTRLTLKQEDLKEYEEARARWMETANSKVATSQGGEIEKGAKVVADHKKVVQARIGLSSDK